MYIRMYPRLPHAINKTMENNYKKDTKYYVSPSGVAFRFCGCGSPFCPYHNDHVILSYV